VSATEFQLRRGNNSEVASGLVQSGFGEDSRILYWQVGREVLTHGSGAIWIEPDRVIHGPYAHHWFEKTLGKKTQSGKV